MERELKYRILEILAGLPPSVRRAKRVELRTKLGKSQQMLGLYLNTTKDKSMDFDGMELPVIARILNCKIEDLFTQVETIESC